MKVIDVVNSVREYPDDTSNYNTLLIRNHWNNRDKVVLEIDGKHYTFIADHIIRAIQNALNAH